MSPAVTPAVTPALARRLWTLVEPIHCVTYFAPEALAALAAAGYRGFWMGYFAGRAAPLGSVGAELVSSTFYNFDRSHVARAVPDAWDFAPPSAALAARLEGSVASLRQAIGDGLDAQVSTAVEILRPLADTADVGGRPLYAANTALAWPADPLAQLWHATTLLREHRGDGHIAVLTAAGLGGREAGVFHSLAAGIPRETINAARKYSDAEWQACLGALADRGWLDADGTLTADGHHAKAQIEDTTDRLAATAYASVTDADLDALIAALTPIVDAVVGTGHMPRQAPTGLNLDRR